MGPACAPGEPVTIATSTSTSTSPRVNPRTCNDRPLTATDHSTLDLRLISPRDRHALIFARFDALKTGESLQLVSDHAPRPLRDQFEDRAPGQFNWSTLEAGPAQWRIRITRLATAAIAAGSRACCSGGACCG